MSFAQCLAQLTEDGTIDRERAARFSAEYDRLSAAYGKTMGKVAAADLASRDTLAALEFQAVQDRRQALLQIGTQRQLLTGLGEHLDGGGQAGHYAIATMEHHEAAPGVAGVENVRGALSKLAWSRMEGFLGRYRRDMLGRVTNPAELRDVVRALRGDSVESVEAKQMAAAVGDTFEWLRRQFNAAGGAIPKLAKWGLPQSHDALSVAAAKLDGWKAFIKPLLDPAAMIDGSTGKAFASDEALDEALGAVWRNISSEGMDGQVPGAFRGDGKVANRRVDHRFLVFKDADAWLEYNARFGTGDVFNAIAGHIDGMTRDIAAMQVLGPNPAATVRWLGDVLKQDKLPGPDGRAVTGGWNEARRAKAFDRMWRYYAGDLTAVAPENRSTARFFTGVRQWNILSKLGRAFLSALPTDPVFGGFTARFNGLPVARELGTYLQTFNPADASHRAAAEHAGLVFTEMTQRAERLWREGGKINKLELTRRGADGLLRATFLSPHTVASKQATGLSFMKDWAEHAATDWAGLGATKRLSFERYGIGAGEWDRLRGVAIEDQDGIELLRPGDLARSGDDADLAAAVKFFTLIDSETRFGTPGEHLRAQTALAVGGKGSLFERGTIAGELAHSATQFKTYSVIMTMTHMQRALYGRGGMSRAGYALTLPIFLTLAGTLGYVLRTIALGEDPPPLDDPRTWMAGFAVGGGAGMAGDFVTQGLTNDRGNTVLGFLAGPTLSSVVDPAVGLTLGNIGEAGRGEETHLARELIREGKKNLPGGNAWYAQAALERLLIDRLNEIADPGYAEGFARMERRAAERGTPYWAEPGGGWPERGPDFGNMLGAEPDGESRVE